MKNKETFQPIHFGLRDGTVTDILFLQDNGLLLRYDFTRSEEGRRRFDLKLLDTTKN